jgi:hypothetical protein
MQVLRRFGGSQAWIETGTYNGEGSLAISKFGAFLDTIEPSKELSQLAERRLSSKKNVKIHVGTSEDLLSEILLEVERKGFREVSFWLDGHYSGGNTFLGNLDTPIRKELEIISRHLSNFSRVSIFIDDIRCFNPSLTDYISYPSVKELIEFANLNRFRVLFTKDICVMKRVIRYE